MAGHLESIKCAGAYPWRQHHRTGTDAVAYVTSHGGTQSLPHYLKSFWPNSIGALSMSGFNDVAALRSASCEPALTAGRRLPRRNPCAGVSHG